METKNNIIILVVLTFIVLSALVLAQQFIFKCQLPLFKSIIKCAPPSQSAPAITSSQPTQPQAPTKKISLPKVLYNLAGSIQALEKSAVVLEATIPLLDETGQPTTKMEIRKALVTVATKFSRLTFVPTEDPNRKTPKETTITFKDLKVGDLIEVVSNQDITNKTEFEAILIRLLQKTF